MTTDRGVIYGLAVFLAGGLASVPARAEPAFALIHSFAGPDGASPNAGLLAGQGGVLYGTTVGGGPSGPSAGGVAFSLTPGAGSTWIASILHRFGESATDGASPHSRLVRGRDGALYGTTYSGGVSNQGTIYRLAPPQPGQTEWQETILYSFVGSDGANPVCEIVFDSAGRLYGTTMMGGTQEQGTVYQLSPPASAHGAWTLRTLHSFAGADGRAPRGGLIGRLVGGAFTLFGTTSGGGAAGQGTVFALASPPDGSAAWRHSVLHSFSGGADGGAPNAGLAADRALDLFGTTMQGGAGADPTGRAGGVVFKLMPPGPGQSGWRELVLHGFTGGADGGTPLGAVVEQGRGQIFGTSAGAGYGGCAAQCGTMFMLTPRNLGGTTGPWDDVVLHRFGGLDGDVPSAEVMPVQGRDGALAFFGVTERGGANGQGAVFRVTP